MNDMFFILSMASVLFQYVVYLKWERKYETGIFPQVFQVIRKQVLQELMEEGGSKSSVQDCHNSHNQRTGQFDLPDTTDDDNMSKVTILPFLHSSAPSSVHEVITDPLDNTKDVEQLEKHCRDLKSQLDLVKIEIVKIISEKKACSKENCSLKIHISDLKNRLPMDDVLKGVSCFQSSQDDPAMDRPQEVAIVLGGPSGVIESTRSDDSDVAVNKSVLRNQVSLEASALKGIEMGTVKVDTGVSNLMESNKKHDKQLVTDKENDNSENEKFDLPEKSNEQMSVVKRGACNLVLQIEDLPNNLKGEEETHVREITHLQERCCELENSLELLRQVGLVNVFLATELVLHSYLLPETNLPGP
jgi:hypothetical protein